MPSVCLRPQKQGPYLDGLLNSWYLIKWKGGLHWKTSKELSIPREQETTSVAVRLSGSGHSCRVCLRNVTVPDAEIRQYSAAGLVQLLCVSLEKACAEKNESVRNPEQAEAHRGASSGLCAVLRGAKWTAFRHLHDILVFSTASAKCHVHV